MNNEVTEIVLKSRAITRKARLWALLGHGGNLILRFNKWFTELNMWIFQNEYLGIYHNEACENWSQLLKEKSEEIKEEVKEVDRRFAEYKERNKK